MKCPSSGEVRYRLRKVESLLVHRLVPLTNSLVRQERGRGRPLPSTVLKAAAFQPETRTRVQRLPVGLPDPRVHQDRVQVGRALQALQRHRVLERD